MPDVKVLIIEDDRFLSSILKGRLEKEGLAVAQAYDGDEGLRMIREVQPDLILLDLIMPKVSGFEVLEQMAADPELAQVPVMIASNLGQDSDVEKARSLGAVEYYVKVRTSIDDLAQMVKNVVLQNNPNAVLGQQPKEPQTPAQ
jgi:DNA-binding response OmpR family regulator